MGIFDFSARPFAVILSHICLITLEDGPINTKPLASHLSAKSASSARKPYPGYTASAPVNSAADRIEGMFK
jgi:hypothetical protein